MKVMKAVILLVSVLSLFGERGAQAQSIEFKINPKGETGSDSDLRRRVLALERAVQELQMRMLQPMISAPVAAPVVVSPNRWYCEASAFTKKYDSFGPTELEAKVAVKKKCGAENHSMHCEPVCQEAK